MEDFKNMDWKKFYFCYEGRINRRKLWLNFAVPVFLIGVILAGIDASIGWTYGLSAVFSLAILWPKVILSTKRLHDRGLSGWWQAAPVAAFALAAAGFKIFTPLGVLFGMVAVGLGIWIATQIGFLKGTDGPNRFGADPLEGNCSHCGADAVAEKKEKKIKIERVGAGE